MLPPASQDIYHFLHFFFFGLIKPFGVPSGATRLNSQGDGWQSQNKRDNVVWIAFPRERGGEGPTQRKNKPYRMGLRHGSWGVVT